MVVTEGDAVFAEFIAAGGLGIAVPAEDPSAFRPTAMMIHRSAAVHPTTTLGPC
jgi:hypothetical protein